MLLSILIFLTSLSLVLLFKSLINDDEGLQILSIISLIFITLFGWIIIGISLEQYSTEVKKIPLEILKGKHVAILVFDTHKFQIEGYELEKITEKSTYYYKISYNMYNYISDTSLIIK